MKLEVLENKKSYESALMEIVEVSGADIICTSPGGSAEGDGDGSDAGGWY